MAQMKVFTFENLSQYDGLLKNYINAADAVIDAKSLKTVAIDGNTLKFYKVEEPVGETEPAYEITLPQTDISGLLAKLEDATAGNVVIANADGTVADGGVALADLVTKGEVEAVDGKADANAAAIEAINNEESGILAQAKAHADGKDAAIQAAKDAADAAQADVDALEEAVSGMYTNDKIDELIDAAQKAATYDDTEVRGLVSTLETKVNDNETDIEGKMTALTERVGANETAIADRYTKGEVDSAIATAVANADHLKREIVAVLPAVESADANTIYMVSVADGEGNQKYEEFMLINDVFEKIGDSAVDLTNYATKDEVATAKQEAIDAAAGDATSKANQALADAKADTDAKIAELDSDVASAEVEEGKGVKVQVTEVDGKLTAVAVSGNYDNAYDAKGAAATAESNAKTYAEECANGKDEAIAAAQKAGDDAATAVTTLENGKVADNTAAIEALEGLVGEGYVAITEEEIAGLFA